MPATALTSLSPEDFIASLPYKVTPIAVKGVYANPALPDDFDFITASQKDLIKHGFLFRKPTQHDPQHVHEAYKIT